MVFYVNAIGQWQILETNAKQRGKIKISFPVKLESWCCASSGQRKNNNLALGTFIVINNKIHMKNKLKFMAYRALTPRYWE